MKNIGNMIMQQKSWLAFLLITLCTLTSTLVQGREVIINKVGGDKELLIVDILTLALSKSAPQYKIKPLKEALPQSRLVKEVNQGNVDVVWFGVTPELESELLTIRIPVLKGLLGHRLFIIKKGEQPRFNKIKTVDDLRLLKAGQGTSWGDTTVLKNAGLPTITTLKYQNLFRMLDGGRFDYFPRAIHEPWAEVNYWPELGLTVEKKIMLVYPFAMYFFVAKNNQALHDEIYKGLEIAIADGSFDELFFNNQTIKDALTQSDIKNRTIIHIDNLSMHPDTPIDRKEFWLDPTNL